MKQTDQPGIQMKVLIKLLAATALLVLAGEVLAEGNWQFNIEVGGSRGECNSVYTGSTADALGCSAITPDARTSTPYPVADTDSGQADVLSLVQAMDGAEVAPLSPPTAKPGQFWVMADGEALDYGQIVLSALMERAADSSSVDIERDMPAALPAGVTIVSNLNPVSKNGREYEPSRNPGH